MAVAVSAANAGKDNNARETAVSASRIAKDVNAALTLAVVPAGAVLRERSAKLMREPALAFPAPLRWLRVTKSRNLKQGFGTLKYL